MLFLFHFLSSLFVFGIFFRNGNKLGELGKPQNVAKFNVAGSRCGVKIASKPFQMSNRFLVSNLFVPARDKCKVYTKKSWNYCASCAIIERLTGPVLHQKKLWKLLKWLESANRCSLPDDSRLPHRC